MIEIKRLAVSIEEENLRQRGSLPRNILFYYMMVGMLIKVYITPHPILIKFLGAMVIILVLAQIYVIVIKDKVEVTVKPLPKVLHKGEHIQLEVTVKNLSRLPLAYTYLCLKESHYLVPSQMNGLCVTLNPRSSHSFRIPYEVIHSGVDEIGIEKVVGMDYLELARTTKKMNDLQEIILLPQLQVIEEEEASKDKMAYKVGDGLRGRQSRVLEGEVSYELAPYEEGTPERLIHWKLVAQRDLYRVREREQLMKSSREYVLIMNPIFITQEVEARKEAALIDQLITFYASYLYNFIQQGQKVHWVGYHKGKWEEKVLYKESDFYEIQEILCNKYFISSLKEKKSWLQFVENKLEEKIVLTAYLDENLKQQIEQEGFKVIWLQEEN